jgi:hypothetical protein
MCDMALFLRQSAWPDRDRPVRSLFVYFKVPGGDLLHVKAV